MNRIAKIILKIPIRGGGGKGFQSSEFQRIYAIFGLVL